MGPFQAIYGDPTRLYWDPNSLYGEPSRPSQSFGRSWDIILLTVETEEMLKHLVKVQLKSLNEMKFQQMFIFNKYNNKYQLQNNCIVSVLSFVCFVCLRLSIVVSYEV